MIMGISPGTRSIGTAILHEGVLIDWGVKMFKEEWSDRKLAKIIKVLETHIKNYSIKVIAVKRCHVARTSDALEQVCHGIMLLAKQMNVRCRVYTLEELKHHCNGIDTKHSLMSYIFQNYPEVQKGIKLTSVNFNYYMKTVEAVALAHILN